MSFKALTAAGSIVAELLREDAWACNAVESPAESKNKIPTGPINRFIECPPAVDTCSLRPSAFGAGSKSSREYRKKIKPGVESSSSNPKEFSDPRRAVSAAVLPDGGFRHPEDVK